MQQIANATQAPIVRSPFPVSLPIVVVVIVIVPGLLALGILHSSTNRPEDDPRIRVQHPVGFLGAAEARVLVVRHQVPPLFVLLARRDLRNRRVLRV